MKDNQYPSAKFGDVEVINITDSSGGVMELVEYDGYFFSKIAMEMGRIADCRENMPKIPRMSLRPDDVLLLAYPKAGTHWTSEIIHMLLKGDTEYHPDPKEKLMLPFETPDSIDQMPSPRIINSHMYCRHLPQDILNKRNKVVFVNRNPKDIVVSFYHHCQRGSTNYQGSFSDFLEYFMSEQVYHCPWYKYMLDWERVFQAHPELEVLFVNYEDLKKNPVAEIKRLADFLEAQNTIEFYNKVAEKCHFDNLKQDYSRRNSHISDIMFRKGSVGGWKDNFTVAQNERFEKFLADKMKFSSWKFIYDI